MDRAFRQTLKEMRDFQASLKWVSQQRAWCSNAFQIPFECILIPANMEKQIKELYISRGRVCRHAALDSLAVVGVGAIQGGQPSKRAARRMGKSFNLMLVLQTRSTDVCG